eukprot:scaffold34984_cov101-Isochrysis_galbana.AAC.4
MAGRGRIRAIAIEDGLRIAPARLCAPAGCEVSGARGTGEVGETTRGSGPPAFPPSSCVGWVLWAGGG